MFERQIERILSQAVSMAGRWAGKRFWRRMLRNFSKLYVLLCMSDRSVNSPRNWTQVQGYAKASKYCSIRYELAKWEREKFHKWADYIFLKSIVCGNWVFLIHSLIKAYDTPVLYYPVFEIGTLTRALRGKDLKSYEKQRKMFEIVTSWC